MKRVALVSTFGPNVRGVSPYADSLSEALGKSCAVKIRRIDFNRAFPRFLLPGGTSYEADNEFATINYMKPHSWGVCSPGSDDVLHIQYWSPAFLPVTIGVLQAARKSGTKTVVTWHNPKPHESLPLLGKLERYMLRLCDGVISHTNQGKNLLTQAYSKSNVMVCHHGCHAAGIHPPSIADYERCGLSPDHRHLLFFGNIRPYKGVDTLLDAWNQVHKRFPETRLIIAGRLWGSRRSMLSRWANAAAGTTAYAKTIEQQLSNAGSSVVSDLTFIPNAKIEAYLRIADLAVFPYRSFESQSGAASLVAGAGMPLITSGVGGLTDLAIDKRFITEDLSSRALADVISNRLNDDRNYRNEQLEVAKNFSWEAAAEKHLNFYEEI